MSNESQYFNSKYHVSTKQTQSFGFFGFLDLFKMKPTTISRPDQRPAYPILNPYPNFTDILLNLNKSDAMFYFSFMTLCFFVSNHSLRAFYSLRTKLVFHHVNMHVANIVGLISVSAMSEGRLKGQIDNGLRWKPDDLDIKKYDFTSEYKKKSFFGYFHKD